MTQGWSLGEFEAHLLRMTPLGAMADFETLGLFNAHEFHRKRIHYVFDVLPEIPKSDRPLFVFAHIIAPHPRYVFGADGSPRDPQDPFAFVDNTENPELARVLCADQLTFISGKVMKTVEKILANSQRESVIILQGDHGPGTGRELARCFDRSNANRSSPLSALHSSTRSCVKENLAILNASYFPDKDYRALYDSISPVNRMRILVDELFDGRTARLEDRCYLATYEEPYKFVEVTDVLTADEGGDG